MSQIIPISQKRTFTLEEARELLPVIRRITKEAVEKFVLLEQKLKKQQALSQDLTQSGEAVEGEISDLLNKWSEKIAKLGAFPKGIWLIDFDSGEGYYCWRYDEETVDHFHGYEEGFSSRTLIQ